MEENEIFTQEQIDKINEIVKTAFAEAAKGLAEHETAIEERESALTKKEQEAAAGAERERLIGETETVLLNKGLPAELAAFLNCIERGTIQKDVGTISMMLEDWRLGRMLKDLDEHEDDQRNKGNSSIRKIFGLKG